MKLPSLIASGAAMALFCPACKENGQDAATGPDPAAAQQAPRQEARPSPQAPESRAETGAPRVQHDADLARLMAGFGETVKGVRDQASWIEAKPRIEAILAEISTVSAKLRALPAPTEADRRTFLPRTAAREKALEESLGDKNAFLARLPGEVAAELGTLAGQFFNNMGEAQILLRGQAPPDGAGR